MPITIYSQCTYYPEHANKLHKRDNDLWASYVYARAVKYRDISKYLNIPNRWCTVTINKNNIRLARKAFGKFIRLVIEKKGGSDALIVPVPSKDSFNTTEFRSLVMVREALGVDYLPLITPALLYNTQLTTAASGGNRWPDQLKPYMDCGEDLRGRDVIIVDDIATSGSSILVAKEKLIKQGANVLYAVVCGRTSTDRNEPWRIRSETMSDLGDDLEF